MPGKEITRASFVCVQVPPCQQLWPLQAVHPCPQHCACFAAHLQRICVTLGQVALVLIVTWVGVGAEAAPHRQVGCELRKRIPLSAKLCYLTTLLVHVHQHLSLGHIPCQRRTVGWLLST